jgi:hypothetical protein
VIGTQPTGAIDGVGTIAAVHEGCIASPRVLDPCCGSRMWWFDRGHPDALFCDRRREELTVTDRSHGNADGTRTLRIDPDGSFKLVAFDPPHLFRAGPKSWLAAKYGRAQSAIPAKGSETQ